MVTIIYLLYSMEHDNKIPPPPSFPLLSIVTTCMTQLLEYGIGYIDIKLCLAHASSA